MKVYYQQLKTLNQPGNIQDKNDIIKSENKLQQMGFVKYIRNLPSDVQVMLQENPIKYFIPWRAVWKGNSISTRCRVVFDASQATSSGYSLNDILAKGRNNLNKLQEILIHWSMHRVAVHTDISKMYNTVRLNQSDWCYQRYIWDPDLDPSRIPEEKVIRTLIYGVRSSGNQAEYGLRKVAELSQYTYPEVNHIVQNDIYVDDCITREDRIDLAHHRADELEIVLNRGGFNLKGVSFSGEDPPSTLTEDGQMIFGEGMKWFVKEDMLSINTAELNFAKKHRGKNPSSTINVIPSKLTCRHCASNVAEIFDLTGKVSPITASMKMDLQELVHHKLDWDDTMTPQGMSQPRAELYAALINAYAGEVVRRSFKQYHKEAIKFTDSQISLHWITNEEKPLKQWTRNRVIEILRFTTKAQWYYVQTKDMLADIGTRKGVKVRTFNQNNV